MATEQNDNDSNGAHDGYAGDPGTYLLQDGKRIAVDPETLKPMPPESNQAIEQTPEPTKPAAKQAKEVLPAANTTE